MQKIVATIILLLFVAACTEAQRGNRGRGRGQGGRPGGRPGGKPGGRPGGGPGGRFPALKDAEKYEWDVDVSGGVLIPQKAFVIQDKEVVTIITISKDLRSLNITPSVIFMNPNTGNMVIKLAGRRAPCFLTSFSATKIELESDFTAWNDTTITLANMVALNGTSPPLTKEEAGVEVQNDRALGRLCRGGKMVKTSVMTAGTEDPETRVIELFGYDTQISIMVPEKKPKDGPGGNDGGVAGGRGDGDQGEGQGQGQGEGQGEGQNGPRIPGGRGRGQGRNQNGPRPGGRGQGGRGRGRPGRRG